VLSLSEVADYTPNIRDQAAMAVRPQLITRLLEKYNCAVVSRLGAMQLAMESKIRKATNITQNAEGAFRIMAADYAVRVQVRATGGKDEVRVQLAILDLRGNEGKKFDQVNWVVPAGFVPDNAFRDYGAAIESIAEKIGEQLHLTARQPVAPKAEKAGSADLVWAVLPITRLDKAVMKNYMNGWSLQGEERKIIESEFDISKTKARLDELSARSFGPNVVADTDPNLLSLAEVSLQKGQSVKRVVDRAALDAVLQEMKLGSLLDVNENVGGCLARLVGADRFVMGSVALGKAGLRLDMHLVDAHTSAVLDARTATCTNEASLGQAVADMTKDFASRREPMLSFKSGGKEQRRREAEAYLESLTWYGPKCFEMVSHLAAWQDRAESIYLLMNDDPAFLKDRIDWYVSLMNKLMKDSPWLAVRTVALFDQMLTQYPHDELVNSPLLWRAQGHVFIRDFATVLSLVEEHSRANPTKSPFWTGYLKAISLYRTGRAKDAYELARNLIESYVDKDPAAGSRVGWERQATRELALLLSTRIALDESVFSLESAMQCMDLAHEISRLPGGTWGEQYMERFPFCDIPYLLVRKVARRDGLDAAVRVAEEDLRAHGYKGAEWTHDPSTWSPGYPGEKTDARMNAILGDILFLAGKTNEAIRYMQTGGNYGVFLLKQYGIKEPDPYTPAAFKTGAQIKPIPKEYKIYCIPDASANRDIARGVAKRVGDWFGTAVVVMDPVPVPVGTYDEYFECQEFRDFSRQLLQNARIPDDAMLVFFLTGQLIAPPNGLYPSQQLGTPWDGGNPCAASHWGGQSVDAIVANLLPMCLIRAVLHPIATEWRGETRDIVRCRSKTEGCQAYRTTSDCRLCPDCAKEYAKLDFAQVHAALHSYLARKIKMLDMPVFSFREIKEDRYCSSPGPFRLEEARKLAEKGDAKAQAFLALVIERGHCGATVDYEAAVQWAQKSADQKCPLGLYSLGRLYVKGRGVMGDLDKAKSLFEAALSGLKAAAEKGDPVAQNNLGVMYAEGFGVTQDKAAAFEWFIKAAAKNDVRAQVNLSYMLLNGVHVAKDVPKGLATLTKAAEQGFSFAQAYLGSLYYYGPEIPSKDHAIAAKWIRLAAEQGDPVGQCEMGNLYSNGWGVRKDDAEATHWYVKAADQGDVLGHVWLSVLSMTGRYHPPK